MKRKRLGAVLRADEGGLAAQSISFSNQFPIDRALVVDVGNTRGVADASRLCALEVRVTDGLPNDDDVNWLIDKSDVIWSAETFYNPMLVVWARAKQVRTVLTGNPELFQHKVPRPDVVTLPTAWQAHTVGGATVLQWPVDLADIAEAPRTHADKFVHVSTSAMADREGTEIVKDAIAHMKEPAAWHVRLTANYRPAKLVPSWVNLTSSYEMVADRKAIWPDDGDVYVVPRRYGGLSLLTQEAAARGMAIIHTDTMPYNFHPRGLLPTTDEAPRVRMLGGHFRVQQASPTQLADICDHLVSNPDLAAEMAKAAWDWAIRNSWPNLRTRWEQVLGL